MPFPADLHTFVESEEWTFAKTMPEWPHEYLVRGRVHERLFERLVVFIREQGRPALFYATTNVYYEEDGRTYWTMGAPVGETEIINRCRSEDTYERRLAAGRLP